MKYCQGDVISSDDGGTSEEDRRMVLELPHIFKIQQRMITRTQLSGYTGSTNSHSLGADIVYLIPATSTKICHKRGNILSKIYHLK